MRASADGVGEVKATLSPCLHVVEQVPRFWGFFHKHLLHL